MTGRFEIRRVNNNGDINRAFLARYGLYYVVANPGKENTYIGYLHCDGSIHVGTLNNSTSQYTGWYKTKKAAKRAIEFYEAGA